MTARLSPTREAEIRAKHGVVPPDVPWMCETCELLAELDAVRRERDEVQHRSDERLKDYQAKAKTLQGTIANLREERDEAIESALYLEGRWRATLAERDEAVKVAATMRDALERIANDDPYPVHTALVALAAVPSSTAAALCDGSLDCTAARHVHGCYADAGDCDEPGDHAPAPFYVPYCWRHRKWPHGHKDDA